jgi:hypothetical protein
MPETSSHQISLYAIDPVLPVPEAAKIAGCSQWTLKRARSRGELRILQLSPRRIGIRMSDLTQWLDSRPQNVGGTA